MSLKNCSPMMTAAVWFELLRYDLLMTVSGFQGVYRRLLRQQIRTGSAGTAVETEIAGAVNRALSLYPKQVQCLQRSFVTAQILMRSGVEASVAIGYRSVPFFGYAWVEVDNKVFNDHPSHRSLTILLRTCATGTGITH